MTEPTDTSVRAEVRNWLEANWNPDLGLVEWRMKLMEFLDATPEGLTPADGAEFVRPRIAGWDIDLETNAMRIVLRSQDPAPRQVRALSI